MSLYNNLIIKLLQDSCYNLVQCVAAGHQIVALANLKPLDRNVDELGESNCSKTPHARSLSTNRSKGL